jgi:predicted phosphoadenosine phosphosulfate sulfurtransferase
MVIGQVAHNLPQITLSYDQEAGDIHATGVLGMLYGRVSNYCRVEVLVYDHQAEFSHTTGFGKANQSYMSTLYRRLWISCLPVASAHRAIRHRSVTPLESILENNSLPYPEHPQPQCML